MKEEYRSYRLYFEWPDGTEDSVVIDGDTFEERREAAEAAMKSRGATCTGQERIV